MKTALPLLLFVLILSSCSIEKRHYRKGYFVDKASKKSMRMKTYPVLLLTPREPVLTASVESQRMELNSGKQIGNYRVYDRTRKHLFRFKLRLHLTMPEFLKHHKKNHFKTHKHFNLHRPTIFVKHGRTIKVHHWRRKR
jgi:hypothetical protein